MTNRRTNPSRPDNRRRLIVLSCAALFLAILPVAAKAATTPGTTQNTGDEDPRPVTGVELPADAPVPTVGAASWAIMDARSGEMLAGSRERSEAPMASTTKVMTVLVTLRNADLDEEVTVSENAASFAIPEYSNAGLTAGDVLTVREMLQATLLVSGNDAAVALAEHVGGDVDGFVEMMNDEAERLGLDGTHFENPTGLDDRGHRSNPRDLARLARAAFEYPEFARDVATDYAVVTTEDREIPLANINELLYLYPAATGVKTGTSPGAGPSLVASAAAEDESYIVALLDDPDRYGSAVQLLDYGFLAYDRTSLVRAGERYESVMVPFRRDRSIPLVAGNDIPGLVEAGSEVTTEVDLPEDLPDSVRRGDRVGSVLLEIDGRPAGKTALVAGRGYEEAPIWRKLWYRTSSLWE